MVDQMRLKTKIVVLVAAVFFGLVSLVVFSATEMRRELIDGCKAVIRSMLEGTYATVSAYHAQELEGKLTREQAQKAAAEAISMIRYGGKDGKSEYVYAFTTEGVGTVRRITSLSRP